MRRRLPAEGLDALLVELDRAAECVHRSRAPGSCPRLPRGWLTNIAYIREQLSDSVPPAA